MEIIRKPLVGYALPLFDTLEIGTVFETSPTSALAMKVPEMKLRQPKGAGVSIHGINAILLGGNPIWVDPVLVVQPIQGAFVED